MSIEVMDLLPRLADICNRYGIEELSVFGSVARGEDRPDSDIDILFTMKPNARIGFIEMGRIEEELEALLGRPVDLVSKNGLHWVIRDQVLSDAQVLIRHESLYAD